MSAAVVGAMAPERWQRLRPLLDRALDLDGIDRDAFLDELSLQSQELREDIERMLQRHAQTAVVDSPAAAFAGAAFQTAPQARVDRNLGRRIGAFELTELLGSGGMGAVYAADRVSGQFQQRVAIKLITGIHPGLTARFARERQILADLRHPNIAQFIDGGETEDGLPYITMEYVQGHDIAHWVTRHDCDVKQRLLLVIEVAEALDYAHRRGVIHRDIKPGNVLVSEDGHVKLLDFGIARLIDSVPGTTLTQAGIGPMTPEYAAPEQFQGGELSAATDIYQLAVLMFRLLSGRFPYAANAANALAWARAVSSERPLDFAKLLRATDAPMRPEHCLRSLSPPDLRRLNDICARALAKDPAERHSSMAALVADIRSYIENTRRPDLPKSSSKWRAWGLAAAFAVGAIGLGYPLSQHWVSVSVQNPIWPDQPALTAMGLRLEDLHVSSDQGAEMIRNALMTEARGDVPAALALLETAHQSDSTSPIPAMLITYWGTGRINQESLKAWQAKRDERLRIADDPYLDLLARFCRSDNEGDYLSALRYSQALLELRPKAWFLRLARAHMLNSMGSRSAALKELQAIEVNSLGHRKLVAVIADRASMGDLAGALAVRKTLPVDTQDPGRARLDARLALSAGDLRASRDHFVAAAGLARQSGIYSAEARDWLWAGLYSACLDERPLAIEQLRLARVRLISSEQYDYAFDTSAALAQLHALSADRAGVLEEMAQVDTFAARLDQPKITALQQLLAARLVNRAVVISADKVSDPTDYGQQLLRVRHLLQQHDRDGAANQLQRAFDEGVANSMLVEEAALLARELGMPEPKLLPIDPPYGPYTRFAARWALSAGMSVVPERVNPVPVSLD